MVEPTVGREGVDGFPFLPIRDQLNPRSRELFNHFFTSAFDRLVLMVRAPPIAANFKTQMLQVALTTPAYCTGVIAQARVDFDNSRAQLSPDRESIILYNKVIEVYRRHLTLI
jgi:hypothetical protein